MNAIVKGIDRTYYDSDYPSKEYSKYPENFDETVVLQGLAFDVDKYKGLASDSGNTILELCCGTGRVAIPLAKAGYSTTGVDFSDKMLNQLKAKLSTLDNEINKNLKVINQDVTILDLEKKDFDMIICAFNSLMCIPDFELQLKALESANKHLRKGGLLVLDLMNPVFVLNIAENPTPKPFFTRKNVNTGNYYTRFAAMGQMQTDQRQKLYGWYDEIEPDGTVKRSNYELFWRIIFRYEIELMLEKTGFKIVSVAGGHKDESFTPTSRKMFVQAVKV